MKKIIVIYHGNCADGFGGAWAARRKFGEKAVYLPAHHQNPPLGNWRGKQIYLIDFVYNSAAKIIDLLKGDNCLTIIDHHQTAAKLVKLAQNHVFNTNRSAAVLAWRYFHPQKKLPVLLRQIEDFDLWKFKRAGSRKTMAYLETAPFNFQFWNKLSRKFETAVGRRAIWRKGRHYLELQNHLMEQLANERVYFVKFSGKKAAAINAPHFFASGLGSLLIKKHSVPLAIIWSRKGETANVSLRSDGDFDVGKLAAKYGGGGHKAAAGFQIKNGEFPWRKYKN